MSITILQQKREQPLSGTVIGKTGASYRVSTVSGAIISATSSRLWSVGSWVTVLSGEIIGVSGRPQPPTVYEV